MMDTIEMLEAIGSDASLRHASVYELTAVLEQANASQVLMNAVASGDTKDLSEEAGPVEWYSPQISQVPYSPDS